MNVIIVFIVLASALLLLIALFVWSSRRASEASDELQKELHPHESTDESALPSASGDSRLMQQPEWDFRSSDKVTSSLPSAANDSRCPACGETITAMDERCPSCGIAFVTDGSEAIMQASASLQKWKPGTVGPANAIRRPPTEFSG